jgi:hypothetical protein
MAANYVLLERIELNASAASVTFSNIPQSGYTDLKIVTSIRTSRAVVYDFMNLTFNGSTTGYTFKSIQGDGASAVSEQGSTYIQFVTNGNTATANTFGSTDIYIPNYTSSNYKSVSIDTTEENNATTSLMEIRAGLWSNTAAITSVTITPYASSTLSQYSTFSLYALAAVGTTPVIAPKASGGNITTDGTYWYHTFLTSGAFVPTTGLTCDSLVIAGGGGGGGSFYSGGGGAGGLRAFTSQSFGSSSYTITVGAGGTGGAGSGAYGVSGTSSSISGTAISVATSGGGSGAASITVPSNGTAGGSGGGAADAAGNNGTGGAGNAGSYSPVEGYAGGKGGGVVSVADYSGGGGGGAGGVGGNGANGSGGAGGAGTNTYNSITFTSWLTATSTGVSSLIAGGGGGGSYTGSGGTAGSGGGGAGGVGSSGNQPGSAGVTNTGGGGGGASGSGAGGNGGSGIIIIRYAV